MILFLIYKSDIEIKTNEKYDAKMNTSVYEVSWIPFSQM